MNGIVKWFNNKKGYGFIANEEGQDIFVHYTGIIGDKFRAVKEGDNVVFDVSETPKGLNAINVVVENIKGE